MSLRNIFRERRTAVSLVIVFLMVTFAPFTGGSDDWNWAALTGKGYRRIGRRGFERHRHGDEPRHRSGTKRNHRDRRHLQV